MTASQFQINFHLSRPQFAEAITNLRDIHLERHMAVALGSLRAPFSGPQKRIAIGKYGISQFESGTSCRKVSTFPRASVFLA